MFSLLKSCLMKKEILCSFNSRIIYTADLLFFCLIFIDHREEIKKTQFTIIKEQHYKNELTCTVC